MIDEIEGCPGAFDDWLDDRAIPAIVYEIEQGGLPEICARHLPGLTALLRADAAQFPLTTRLRRGGLMYSTRMTAARLCVVSSPGYGPSKVPEVGGTSP